MAKATTQTGNPFLNGDFPGVLDFTKLAEQFRLPGVDSDALLENQRRNFEAVTKANQVLRRLKSLPPIEKLQMPRLQLGEPAVNRVATRFDSSLVRTGLFLFGNNSEQKP